MSAKIKNPISPRSQEIKDKTHLSTQEINYFSDEAKDKMKDCLDAGLPSKMVADMFSQGLKKALDEASQNITKKIKEAKDEAIATGEFQQTVRRTGRDSWSYQKVISVDGQDYSFDQKDFNSERQCRQWLRMKKIHIKF